MKKKINDFLLILGVCMMILGALLLILILYDQKVEECRSDPLTYAAQKYTEEYGFDFVGWATLLLPKGNSPTIYFSSNGTSILEN